MKVATVMSENERSAVRLFLLLAGEFLERKAIHGPYRIMNGLAFEFDGCSWELTTSIANIATRVRNETGVFISLSRDYD